MLSRKRIGGFTFIELMIVVAMLGIILTIAVPNIMKYRRRQSVKNATNELLQHLRAASLDAKKGERLVEVRFKTYTDMKRPELSGLYYIITRDINDDGVIDTFDTSDLGEGNRTGGTIVDVYPSKNGVQIWGAGIENNKKLTFGKGGRVEESQTDLTSSQDSQIGNVYYAIMLSSKKNANMDIFQINVYWDGRAEAIKNQDVKEYIPNS